MAMINTKERLLSFFSASATTGMPVFFFGKAGNGRCAEAEKESTIEKERKTITDLFASFLEYYIIYYYTNTNSADNAFCAIIINLFQCLSDLPMSDSIYQVSSDVLIESPSIIPLFLIL